MAVGKGKNQFSINMLDEYILLLDADCKIENRSRAALAAKIIMDYYSKMSKEEKIKKITMAESMYPDNTEAFKNLKKLLQI